MSAKVHKVAILGGDGIGPEVVDATLMVLDAVQKTGLVHLEYLKGDAGFDAIKKYGTNLPDKTIEMMKRTSACLKGPMTTPEEPGTPRSAAVTIRALFNLYANVRPARTLPNVTALKPGRSEEHTSELQSLAYLVCRLLLEKKKKKNST